MNFLSPNFCPSLLCKVNVLDGNPIKKVETFGKYAFIELRTPREATHALSLNNITFLGCALQVTRPGKYQGKDRNESHANWEQVLAKFNMKPEDFSIGKIVNPAVLASTPMTADVQDGEDINTLKAELAHTKRALEITQHQLEESRSKSDARKEQLQSLNKKWAEGKNELVERKEELEKIKQELSKKRESLSENMESHLEAKERLKKHDETSTMLRGVTESLLRATERLQNERNKRRDLEKFMRDSATEGGVSLNSTAGSAENKRLSSSSMAVDFSQVRSDMQAIKSEDGDVEMKGDTATATADGDETNEDSTLEVQVDGPSTLPGPPLDTTTPRSGVALCRMLIKSNELVTAKDIGELKEMAQKYNLGGYVKTGRPSWILIEGLEFNCDILMDNLATHKKKFTKSGSATERSIRAFPKELNKLEGKNAMEDFTKACETVGLKNDLDQAA
jgi:hypothetical protein